MTPWTAVEEVKAGLRMDCWEETPKASAPARHATTERAVKRMAAIQRGQARTGGTHYQSAGSLQAATAARADIIERINSIERKINVRIRSSAVLGRLNHSSIILKSREGA